jgi:hypothetical protein
MSPHSVLQHVREWLRRVLAVRGDSTRTEFQSSPLGLGLERNAAAKFVYQNNVHDKEAEVWLCQGWHPNHPLC